MRPPGTRTGAMSQRRSKPIRSLPVAGPSCRAAAPIKRPGSTTSTTTKDRAGTSRKSTARTRRSAEEFSGATPSPVVRGAGQPSERDRRTASVDERDFFRASALASRAGHEQALAGGRQRARRAVGREARRRCPPGCRRIGVARERQQSRVEASPIGFESAGVRRAPPLCGIGAGADPDCWPWVRGGCDQALPRMYRRGVPASSIVGETRS